MRLIYVGLAVWIGGACAGAPEPAPTPALDLPSPYVPADWPLFAEAVSVPAAHAAVSSVHPVASEVGAIIMNRGGNAVDAAVAVGFALAVVHPSAGNIGGGGFMVIRLASGEAYTLDYRETSPAGESRDMYLDSLGELTETSVVGHLAAGVPGSVAGLTEAQGRFGKLTLAEVMEPAVRLARDGFVLDERRVRSIESAADRLSLFPASREQFLMPDGSVPPAGHLLVQSDLGRTLQAIADSGARVFYEGGIADLIVAEMERGGGLITSEDLAGYRAIWREPIRIGYRGHTIYSMPPASSGGVTMGQILNILEGFEEIPAFGSAEQVHLVAEAMRRAFVDRNHYLGDPAFVDMPIEMLLSKSYAAELRRSIQPDRATPTPMLRPGMGEGDNTTHYSVVDADGSAVSVTTTINSGYGSKVTVPGAGFLLNNEMDDFTGAPGQPNQYGLIQGDANGIEPGKRMLSAMTPAIVLDPDGDLLMLVGTPGGPTIITTVVQVISNVIDHRMTLAEAIAAPRVHHQALPDEIFYENGGLRPDVAARLLAWGHALNQREGYRGEAAGIIRTQAGWVAVADPRSGGGSAGY
jgi:gamma-glutamyltranspeptidase/glutathione hydrolase